MRTMIMILALAIPLAAQDSSGVKEEAKQEKTLGKRVWTGLQDAEWKKYNAAHNRAHSKRGEQYSVRGSKGDKRQKMHKKQQLKNVVRLAVVGGLAYYIGYHKGQHNKHPMKHRPYLGDRK